MDRKRIASRRIYGYLCQNEQDKFIYCCRTCHFECTNSNQLEKHTLTHKQISDLDIKCMENIFKFLPSDDLAAMSLTCQTYKIWSEEYFWRKRKTGTVQILADDSIHFDFRNAKFYEIYFSSLVPSVRLSIEGDATSLEMIFQFIKKNCCKQFKSFEIWASEPDIEMDDHVQLIQDQIKELEILDINYVSRIDIFTKYARNLKALIFKFYGIEMPFDIAFMNESFPHLKSLIIETLSTLQIDLTTFLNRNPQLVAVIVENCFLAIKTLLQINVKLPLVIVKMQFIRGFEEIKNEFKFCCQQANVKSLELVFNYPDSMDEITLRQIFSSEYIEGLHYSLNRRIKYDGLKVQPNLKRLCLSIETELTTQMLDDLVKMIMNYIPNLNELRIEATIGWRITSIRNILIPIISRVKTLNHIYLKYHEKVKISQFDVMKLNEVRSALMYGLMGPTIMTIHLNNELTNIVPSLPETSSILIMFETQKCMSCCLCSSDGQQNLQFLRDQQIIQF